MKGYINSGKMVTTFMDSPSREGEGGGLWHSTRTRRTPRPSRALKDRRFTPDSCHEGVIPGYQLKKFDSSGRAGCSAAARWQAVAGCWPRGPCGPWPGSGINFLKVTLSASF